MLYEQDFALWADTQAQALAAGRYEDLDLVNLADEVGGLTRSDKRALLSRAGVLIGHLMKWQHQPGKRGKSWFYTIREQRESVTELLEDSPSLKGYLEAVLERAHKAGHVLAHKETQLDWDLFTDTRFTFEQLLDTNYYPE